MYFGGVCSVWVQTNLFPHIWAADSRSKALKCFIIQLSPHILTFNTFLRPNKLGFLVLFFFYFIMPPQCAAWIYCSLTGALCCR